MATVLCGARIGWSVKPARNAGRAGQPGGGGWIQSKTLLEEGEHRSSQFLPSTCHKDTDLNVKRPQIPTLPCDGYCDKYSHKNQNTQENTITGASQPSRDKNVLYYCQYGILFVNVVFFHHSF